MEHEDAIAVTWNEVRPGCLVSTTKHFVELYEQGTYGFQHVDDIDIGDVVFVLSVQKHKILGLVGGRVGWVLKFDAAFLTIVE